MTTLLPGIRIVASGWLGLAATCDQDATAYLVSDSISDSISDGAEAALIDAGCGLATEAVLAAVGPARVSTILLTHAHADHAAGAAALAAAWGAEVRADPATARILRAADEEAAGLVAARGAGVYPDAVRLVPTAVRDLAPDETVPVGSLRITPLATPGHAAGHTCYLTTVAGRRVAFTGDLVFSRGRVAVLGTPDTDLAALRASIAALTRWAPDVLLPGHGEPVLSEAGRHLQVALDAFAAGQLPPGLLP